MRSATVLPHLSVAVITAVLAAQALTKLVKVTVVSAREEQSSAVNVFVKKKAFA